MGFGERLKLIRKERGLTQREVGEEIFVSRSAVAKWENGLGLPSRASYESLIAFLRVSAEELPLDEEKEKIIVSRNLKRAIIRNSVSWVLILILAVSPLVLTYGVLHGYGFTSKMAAGKIWEDNEVIHSRSYDFYLSTMDCVKEDTGELITKEIVGICVIEKHFFGFVKSDLADTKREVIYKDSEESYGYIRTFISKDENGDKKYYNFLFQNKIFNAELGEGFLITLFDEIELCGNMIPVIHNSHFVTSEPPSEFAINGKALYIKN